MQVDTTPLHGVWSATDETTIGLVQIEIRADADEALALTPRVAGRTGVVQLSDAVAHAYAATAIGSAAASAMTATILADGLSALLTFYLKGEILVLDAFVTPPPGDARVPHYARELFHRADADRQGDQVLRGCTGRRQTSHPRYTSGYEGDTTATLNIAALAGEWDNVNQASTDVHRVSLATPDGIWLHWAGAAAGRPSWQPVTPFAAAPDSTATLGVTTRITNAHTDAIVTGYATRGILVLDCHTRCMNGHRDHLVREFFAQRSRR